MAKMLAMAALVAACLIGCSTGADKAAGLTILNVNDLNDQHKKDKEVLRAKYDGKEVVVMGRATEDFDPNHIYFEIGDKRVTFRLAADASREVWVGVDCKVEAANKDKFAGVKDGDVFAVKGVFHLTQGGMELDPCTRELREAK